MTDVQDALLIAGVTALCLGVGMIYIPAAVMLFGAFCLTAVVFIERSKTNGKKLNGPVK